MSNSRCYWPPTYNHVPPDVFPCGNTGAIQTCCVGSDICLSDSIYHFTHPQPDGSGYYIGGCTDETFSEPACSKHCYDTKTPDIVYNSTSGLWACCSTPNANDCSNPSNETFQATPLDQLKSFSSSLESIPKSSVLISSFWWASNSVSFTSTPTSLASASASFASTSTFLPSVSFPTTSAATTDIASIITQSPSSTIQPDGRGLSLGSGAKVGIVVGAVIVGLLILAGIVYLVRRSKGRHVVLDGPDQSGYIFTGGKAELDSRVRAELESRGRAARAPTELDTWNNRAEL